VVRVEGAEGEQSQSGDSFGPHAPSRATTTTSTSAIEKGETSGLSPKSRLPIVLVLVVVLIVGPKLFIEPGTKAFFQLSSVSGPGL
jgi:hypothetical protein